MYTDVLSFLTTSELDTLIETLEFCYEKEYNIDNNTERKSENE